MRESILVVGSVAALLMLSGCRNQADPNETAARGKPQDPNLSVQASGYHVQSLTAARCTFPDFLLGRATRPVQVTYHDGVTVISRGDTMHHLVAICRDGN